MKQYQKLLILKVVKHHGNMYFLRKNGLEFFQILEYLKVASAEGLIKEDKSEFHITEKGEQVLMELYERSGRIEKATWIEPEYSAKIDKLDSDEVYIPDKKELWFLKNLS